MQKRDSGGMVIVSVPNHQDIRTGTRMSIIRQSGWPRSAFESEPTVSGCAEPQRFESASDRCFGPVEFGVSGSKMGQVFVADGEAGDDSVRVGDPGMRESVSRSPVRLEREHDAQVFARGALEAIHRPQLLRA